MHSSNPNNTKGFTLVEVLVAMVILAIGLLGLASLQAIALKDNQDAYLRSQANLLAYEMNDRMRANASYWKTLDTLGMQNAVSDIQTAAPTLCSVETNTDYTPDPLPDCTPAELAEYDLYRWWQDIDAVLPNAAIAIRWVDDPRTTTPATDVIELKIDWDRSNQAITINRDSDGLSRATLTLDVRL